MYAPRPSLRLTKDFPDKWIFDPTLNSPALRRNCTGHWPSLMCLDHTSSKLPLAGWLDSEPAKYHGVTWLNKMGVSLWVSAGPKPVFLQAQRQKR